MKRLADQTLYEILEVPQDAAPPAIEAAYDRALALYGPGSLATYTLMSAEEATLLTSRIEEAKRTLLDADARERYDAALAAADAHGRMVATGDNAGGAQLTMGPPVIPALQATAERRTVMAVELPPAEDLAGEAPPPAEDLAGEVPPPAEDLAGGVPPPASASPAPASPAPVPSAPVPILLDREISPVRFESQMAPAADAERASPVEIPMPEGSLWTGDALRRVREARGITVQQIAERTKVTRHHVDNIEAERFSALPAPVYLRGILLALARELRLDGQKVARAYLERAGMTVGPSGKPR